MGTFWYTAGSWNLPLVRLGTQSIVERFVFWTSDNVV